MMPFKNYIEKGIIRKITPDIHRGESLHAEAQRKLSSLLEKIDKIGVREDNANDFVEECYNLLMYEIRAKMFSAGYSSTGQGAHEAEVSFMALLGNKEAELQFMDQLRYYRNGILYYGKQFDKEYAEKVIAFTKKIYPKLHGPHPSP